MLFGDELVTEPVLIQRLRAAAREHEATLIVTADAHAQHGTVVHVMDLARQEHVTRFAVQVEQVR